MTHFVEASSTSVGMSEDGPFYSVSKWRIRRHWLLVAHTPSVSNIAAFFRTEDEARRFADTFDLTIRENP